MISICFDICKDSMTFVHYKYMEVDTLFLHFYSDLY